MDHLRCAHTLREHGRVGSRLGAAQEARASGQEQQPTREFRVRADELTTGELITGELTTDELTTGPRNDAVLDRVGARSMSTRLIASGNTCDGSDRGARFSSGRLNPAPIHCGRRSLGRAVASLGVGLVLLACSPPTQHARLSNARGLREGAQVIVAGVVVGTVTSVTVRDGMVDAAFQIEQDHQIRLRQDSCALAAAPAGALTTLVLIPGEGAPQATPTAVPECQPQTADFEALFRTLGQAATGLLQSLGNLVPNGPPASGTPTPTAPAPTPPTPPTPTP